MRHRRNAFGELRSKEGRRGKILDHMPAHACQVEAYARGETITMAKAPAPIEITNDTDSNGVNALRTLRDDPGHLSKMIELTLYAGARNEQTPPQIEHR